jgi:16S rRNA (adenine(1408)-N(1))-methyltransferase
VDLGAGDGGYVLHRARTEPTTFALAIDASPDALTSGAWRANRARLRSAVFLVEGVERLPAELDEIASEATVHFPWGSLLRGLLAADPGVIGPIARLLRPGAELRLVISALARDGHPDVSPGWFERLAPAYADCGLELRESRPAEPADIVATRSSWAKRLGTGRPAVIARYSRLSSRRGRLRGR